jgi:hypothetical protein
MTRNSRKVLNLKILEENSMSASTKPETHPLLLAIAAAAFIVVMMLGVGLFTSGGEHVRVENYPATPYSH